MILDLLRFCQVYFKCNKLCICVDPPRGRNVNLQVLNIIKCLKRKVKYCKAENYILN